MSSSLVLDQGPVAYVASRYQQQDINTNETLRSKDKFDSRKWINSVSLPPNQVPFCARCQLDASNFDPGQVSLSKYETKNSVDGVRPQKGQYSECTTQCLWYPFFSEQRRVKQEIWQRTENVRLAEEKKRYAEELKRKQKEELELAAKQKISKQKERAAVVAAAKV